MLLELSQLLHLVRVEGPQLGEHEPWHFKQIINILNRCVEITTMNQSCSTLTVWRHFGFGRDEDPKLFSLDLDPAQLIKKNPDLTFIYNYILGR